DGGVLEAADGDVVGDPPPGSVQGCQRARGHQVGGDEDRIEIRGPLQQLHHRGVATGARVVAGGDQVGGRVRADLVLPTGEAGGAAGGGRGAGDGGDGAATAAAQVAH